MEILLMSMILIFKNFNFRIMKNLIYLVLLLPLLLHSQTTSQNYSKSMLYKAPTTNGNISDDLKSVNVTYFDGLGRPIQKISNKQSGTGKNIVNHIEYDNFGRQTRNYLPYESTSTDLLYDLSSQVNSYNFYTSYRETTVNPYSETFVELSPLSRIRKQAAPGNQWVGNESNDNDKTIKFVNSTNDTDEVRNLQANATWIPTQKLFNPTLIVDGYVTANELYKNIVKDENWTSGNNNTTEEFKNKQGQVLLKRTYTNSEAHDTYYIYDQFGNLTYVIPPKASFVGGAVQGFEDLCYQYKYDNRNRVVEKKIPGKGWEFLVYDKLDRIAFTGPAFSPWGGSTTGWLFTKHDEFGRIAYTGWYNGIATTTESRTALQDIVSNQAASHENKTSSATSLPSDSQIQGCFYTNKIFPTVSYKVLTINYYDDYTFSGAPTNFSSSIEGQPIFYNNVLKPKTLSTGSWVRALTSVEESFGDTSFILYDYKARPIRTSKSNHFNGYTIINNKFDFTGKILETLKHHKKDQNSAVVTIREYFTYDLQDRLLSHSHKVNNNPVELLSNNTYDELGTLIIKKVGGQDLTGAAAYQNVDYQYNIRGWLEKINNVDALQPVFGPNDLFSFQINYTTASGIADVTPLFNGNISETLWKTNSDNIVRKYGYKYDALNRLRKAFYQKPNSSVSYTAMYDEEIEYDKNGNITYLSRNGNLESDSGAHNMDDLVYRYKSDSNLLQNVTDLTNDPIGFKDNGAAAGINEYIYDEHGNMTQDGNKAIENITYNHLNLPVEILFFGNRKISYIYNAVGQKISKNVSAPSIVQGQPSVNTTTLYLDGFQYENAVLKFFPHAEGYVNVITQQGMQYYSYVYNYLDHLGNVRLSYSYDNQENRLKILEENHYYPFGLKHTNYNSAMREVRREENNFKIAPIPPQVISVPYKYKYNGKEYQDELGLNFYDYGARNYDPALGIWRTIDPKAETSRRFSPYVYALNNPIYFIDPDGMQADDWVSFMGHNGQQQVVYDEGVKTKEQAEAKYQNVTDVFKSGSIAGTSPDGGNDYSYSLKEDGSVVDAGGANIDKGFTTPQGTYVGENKSTLSQIAPVLSNSGDAAVVAGSLMVLTGVGAPIGAGLITYGTYASTAGTVMDLTNDANNGNLTTEKVVTKVAAAAIPEVGGAAFKALGAPAAGVLLNLQTMALDKSADMMRETKTGPYKK